MIIDSDDTANNKKKQNNNNNTLNEFIKACCATAIIRNATKRGPTGERGNNVCVAQRITLNTSPLIVSGGWNKNHKEENTMAPKIQCKFY